MYCTTKAEIANTGTSGPEEFANAFRAATNWLVANRERINALNVFPVPDGDTGDNMVLTMRGGLQAIESGGGQSLADICDALVEGTLNGSRGNSGVILSQMISGLAEVVRLADKLTPRVIAEALGRAAEEGYRAHSEPVEGTMMTVARDLAAEANEKAPENPPLVEFLDSVLAAARQSVVRTQLILPRLQQAGVVDAGGEGLAVLLEGAIRYLKGMETDQATADTEYAHFDSLNVPEDEVFGYCTNFLIRGKGLDLEDFQAKVQSSGRSALVVGNSELIKVHVHTQQPGDLLSYAASKGTLHQIKIDNMDDQFQGVVHPDHHDRDETGSRVTTALVAVASGQGLTRLLRNDARAIVVDGGRTMNPSTGELMDAIARSPADSVIVLPNNPNVVMSAQRAAEASDKDVRVFPTKCVPMGMTAALAHNPDVSPDTNYRSMEAATEDVAALEVTRATRRAEIEGIEVAEGDFIVLTNGNLSESGPDLTTVLLKALEETGADDKELLTVYYGEEIASQEADDIARQVQARFPDLGIDVHEGGQPNYHLLASLE